MRVGSRVTSARAVARCRASTSPRPWSTTADRAIPTWSSGSATSRISARSPIARRDVVIAEFNVLGVLDDVQRKRVLREIHRVLSEDGLLLFSAHNLGLPPEHPEAGRPGDEIAGPGSDPAGTSARFPLRTRNHRRIARLDATSGTTRSSTTRRTTTSFCTTTSDARRRLASWTTTGFELHRVSGRRRSARAAGDDAADHPSCTTRRAPCRSRANSRVRLGRCPYGETNNVHCSAGGLQVCRSSPRRWTAVERASPSRRSHRSPSGPRWSASRSRSPRRCTMSCETPTPGRPPCSAGDQEQMALQFAASLPADEAWADVVVRELDRRQLDGAVGWLTARTVEELSTGDHTFFVGRSHLGRTGHCADLARVRPPQVPSRLMRSRS